jgi:hypothetical protein
MDKDNFIDISVIQKAVFIKFKCGKELKINSNEWL